MTPKEGIMGQETRIFEELVFLKECCSLQERGEEESTHVKPSVCKNPEPHANPYPCGPHFFP